MVMQMMQMNLQQARQTDKLTTTTNSVLPDSLYISGRSAATRTTMGHLYNAIRPLLSPLPALFISHLPVLPPSDSSDQVGCE